MYGLLFGLLLLAVAVFGLLMEDRLPGRRYYADALARHPAGSRIVEELARKQGLSAVDALARVERDPGSADETLRRLETAGLNPADAEAAMARPR